MNAQQIVKFKNDAGAEIEITPQDVTALICPQANKKEVALFLAHCAAHRLDPFTKEAYLIKYGDNPASIVTNYNVFNARAQRFEDYLGIEDGVVILTRDGHISRRQGSAVYGKALGETLLGGWARVKRRNKEDTYVELSLDDYTTGRSKWKTSPGLMINKCAKSAAWRTAYPSEFNGMYSAEEMEQAQAPQPVEAEAVEPVEAPAPQPTPRPQATGADLGPIKDRFEAFQAAVGGDRTAANHAICDFNGVRSMRALTDEQVAATAAYMDATVDAAGAFGGPVGETYEEDQEW